MAGKPKDGDGDRDRDVGTLTRPTESPETVTKKKLERPPLYDVLLHNDDYTTQEFVVYVLMKYFQHDGVTARKIMLHVHTRGIGVAGVYPFEVAETKAHQVVQFARENEMPLQASLRKNEEQG
jgi:ATP-dependent Clp protease adaptor protein ClpS